MTAEDERTVHRLEAFSDIVIGFSVAELAASLTFDAKSASIDLTGVLTFLFSFAIICSLWFFHHRIFARLFVPKTAPILMNFAWLAAVVLLVFVSQQLPTHFNHRQPFQLYFGLYAVAYAILAAQALLGSREHADSDLVAADGRRMAMVMSIWMLVFVADFLVVTLSLTSIGGGLLIDLSFVCGVVATVAARKRFRRVALDERATQV